MPPTIRFEDIPFRVNLTDSEPAKTFCLDEDRAAELRDEALHACSRTAWTFGHAYKYFKAISHSLEEMMYCVTLYNFHEFKVKTTKTSNQEPYHSILT